MRRRMRCAWLAAGCWLLAFVACSAHGQEPADESPPDVIERRGGAESIRGQVQAIVDAGVWMRMPSGASQWISWDRVRRVETGSSLHEEGWKSFAALAEDLWRARTRLERRDAPMAEPLFARHFERYLGGEASETALVVMEGLLRCRLARGERAGAVVPFLEVLRLRRAGAETESFAELGAIMDDSLMLCADLPPVWAAVVEDDQGLAELASQLASYEAHGDEVVATLAQLYLASLWPELEVPRPVRPQHDGVEFMRDLVLAARGSGEMHVSARRRLGRRIAIGEGVFGGGWAEAWARYQIGTALIAEHVAPSRSEGLLQMAHIAARLGSEQPELAAMAMEQLRRAAEEAGHHESVESLRAELVRRFPNYAQGAEVGQ